MQHREQSHAGPERASWMGLMILLQQQLWLSLFPFFVIKETDKRENKKSKISKGTKNKIVCIHLAPYLDSILYMTAKQSPINQKKDVSNL